MLLDGRVVIITGAGMPNGIGAGIARRCVAEGAQVVITDLPGAPLEKTAAALGPGVWGLVGDASNQTAMADVADRVMARHGRLDVLVNNAGIGGPLLGTDAAARSDATAAAASDEAWDQNLAANLRTTYSSSAAVKGHLSEGGSIVNIASVAALSPFPGLPAYGAAKAGVVHYTKTLSLELAPRRIRANCICPGLLWTRAWELLGAQMARDNPDFANFSARQVFEAIVAQATPLGGEQTPDDIGALAVFLASDAARMITGQVIAVDGGLSVR